MQAISRQHSRHYEHTKALTDAACFMQMVYGVEQQQAVAELQPGGQDVHQKRDATDDPAPAAVGIEVLPSIRCRKKKRRRGVEKMHEKQQENKNKQRKQSRS